MGGGNQTQDVQYSDAAIVLIWRCIPPKVNGPLVGRFLRNLVRRVKSGYELAMM